jgi:hypothetical protein
MSRPGFEPRPPAWEASTLEKSHLDSLSAGYSEPLLSRPLLTTFGPLQYNHYYNINLTPKVKTIAPKILAHT